MMWHANNLITWLPYSPMHPFLLGAGLIGIILAILIWLLPILLIVAIIDWLFTSGKEEAKPTDTALEILKERYARGEISKGEFEEKKKRLAS